MVAGMKDHMIIGLDEAETARWKARMQPVVDEWVRSTPDGTRILAAFREELTKFRAGM
jgi:hypothetical protein